MENPKILGAFLAQMEHCLLDADPPAPSSLLATETLVLSEPVAAEAALRGNDVALASMYYEPLKKFRSTPCGGVNTLRGIHTRDLSYTVGASALAEPVAHRITDDYALGQ